MPLGKHIQIKVEGSPTKYECATFLDRGKVDVLKKKKKKLHIASVKHTACNKQNHCIIITY